MVVETKNFLHLDFNLIAKILSSSELNIHSEVEVFNAAISWLNRNSEERSKYSKQLLLKVRFHLLSEDAKIHIINRNSLLTKNNERGKPLKELLLNQKTFNSPRTDKSYKSRYCSQSKFNIILSGCRSSVVTDSKKVYRVNGSNLKNVKSLTPMMNGRRFSDAVSLKGEVYVFNGYNSSDSLVKTVEKYSPSTKTWAAVTLIFDHRERFCVCAFMDKLFTLGGLSHEKLCVTNSCLQFDTKKKLGKKFLE